MSAVRIRQEADLEWLREVHKLAIPYDQWPGDDGVFWVATRSAELLGFASAQVKGDVLELTRCAVVSSAAGTGMQRKLIAVREQYGRRHGCKYVSTYTARDNYASITNLIRSGYRFEPCRSPLYFTFSKRLTT